MDHQTRIRRLPALLLVLAIALATGITGIPTARGTGSGTDFYMVSNEIYQQSPSGYIDIDMDVQVRSPSKAYSGIIAIDMTGDFPFEVVGDTVQRFDTMGGGSGFSPTFSGNGFRASFRLKPTKAALNGRFTVKFQLNYKNNADTEDDLYLSDSLSVVVEVTENAPTPAPTSRPEATPQARANAGDLVVDDYYTVARDETKGQVTVELPLRYKGSAYVVNQLSFIEISPVVEDPAKFPFELNFTGLLRTREQIITKSVDDRYIEYVTFPFSVKPTTENGAYAITFKARYLDLTQNVRSEAPTESTLTVYVQIENGKKPAGPTPDPSRTEAPRPAPKLILTEYMYSPRPVEAGQAFDMSFEVYNTHPERYVQNVTVSLASDKDIVVPVDGSSTFYIPRIDPGGKVKHSMRMMARPDASPAPNQITVSLNYEDDKVTKLEAKELVSVDVQQIPVLTLDTLNLSPLEITPEDVADLTMNMYNKGKGTLYNVMVTLESDVLRAESSFYAGNMEPGSTRACEMVIGVSPEAKAPEGTPVKGLLKVTYEDTYGNETSETKDVELTVAAPAPPADMSAMPGGVDAMAPADTGQSNSTLAYGLIAGGAACLAAAGIGLGIALKRRKKEKELDADAAE